MTIRQTHTYAELEVSAAAYDEIALKLRAASYDHAFMHDEDVNGAPTIDMHGLGLTRAAETSAPAEDRRPDGGGANEQGHADDAGGVLNRP